MGSKTLVLLPVFFTEIKMSNRVVLNESWPYDELQVGDVTNVNAASADVIDLISTGTLSSDFTHNTMGMPSADVLAFHHVLDNVLELPKSSAIRDCIQLESLERISDLIGLEEAELADLNMPKVFQRRFKKLLNWYHNQTSPTVNSWFILTSDQYASYIPSYTSVESNSVDLSLAFSLPVRCPSDS